MSLVICIFLCFYFGCDNRAQELSIRQRDEIAEIGRSSAMILMKDLKTQLMGALENNDTLEAFEACASIAQPLTVDVQEKLPQGVKIKHRQSKPIVVSFCFWVFICNSLQRRYKFWHYWFII